MQEKQEKDYQPPIPVPREGLRIDQIEGDPQSWNAEDIAEDSEGKTDDEIYSEKEKTAEAGG